MRKALMVAAASILGTMGAASAADLGGYNRGSLKDEPTAAYGPNWAGLYIGGTVGYGWGNVEDTDTVIVTGDVPPTTGVANDSDDMNGGVYGAHIGYNFQRGHIVFGAEAGFNGTTLEGATFELEGDDNSHEISWYGTAVARLGYAQDNWLLYGFGGVAWGAVKTDYWGDKDNSTFVGWTAGGGVEYAMNDRLSLRLEYAHVDLGSATTLDQNYSPAEGIFLSDKNETDLEFDTVKVGINYKLGDSEASLK